METYKGGVAESLSPTKKPVSQRMASLDSQRMANPRRVINTPPKNVNHERMSRTSAGFDRVGGGSVKIHSRTRSEAGPDLGVDRTFRATGLSVGVVAGTQRTDAFGFDNYTSPKIDYRYRIAFGNTVQNTKLANFTDIHAKKLQFIPGPKYVQHSDWRGNIKGRTGKFMGAPRTTFTEEVMKYEHKKPAPSKFDNKEALKKKEKVLGNYLVKDNRTHFTDQVKWVAGHYPPAKYNNTNHKITKPKVFSVRIVQADPKPTSTWVVPKMDGPGPGAYETEKAIALTQLPKTKGQSKQTFYPLNFTDQHKKMFAHIPGSGHYKKLETAELKVCKDKNFKYNRH